MSSDLQRRQITHFVLWRPRDTMPAPSLVIGQLQAGNPPVLVDEKTLPLMPTDGMPDLWILAAGDCGLVDEEVYHYWFEVADSDPDRAGQRIRVTDPAARTVDWRLRAPPLGPPYDDDDRDPASVVKFRGGELVACDPDGGEPDWSDDPGTAALPANNFLVIYELPTTWSVRGLDGSSEIGVGTFRDVTALVDPNAGGAHFSAVPALAPGRSHLQELGVNALELLPPADSFVDREWGYATSNYFAADFDLGFPDHHSAPTATTDLVRLVSACHEQGIRFFCDVVMAFATRYVYQNVNYLDFHVRRGTGDPEEDDRQDFGGKLFKYNYFTTSYDPVTGAQKRLCPARQLMKAYLTRWMDDFRCDGLRLDSIENIHNWDFVQESKDLARSLWRDRWERDHGTTAGADERFLAVGEELAVPLGLVHQNRLDGLWNETFLYRLRAALLGQTHGDFHEPDFETAIRNLIDCRRLGFADLSQAVNYLTSHDVEGFRKERLLNFLWNNRVPEPERRIKLAFTCLLTAVGIPMILAGEEFADFHDLEVSHPHKQRDPVNFDRLEDAWRREIFDYVAGLVALRTTSRALAVNDIRFVHFDFNAGKRVAVWQRGASSSEAPVVVVANFSDWGSDVHRPGSEYRVPNWPPLPPGKRWFEVTQQRDVPDEWAGREPLYPWEAKVYVPV